MILFCFFCLFFFFRLRWIALQFKSQNMSIAIHCQDVVSNGAILPEIKLLQELLQILLKVCAGFSKFSGGDTFEGSLWMYSLGLICDDKQGLKIFENSTNQKEWYLNLESENVYLFVWLTCLSMRRHTWVLMGPDLNKMLRPGYKTLACWLRYTCFSYLTVINCNKY